MSMSMDQMFIPAIFEVSSLDKALVDIQNNNLDLNSFGLIYTIVSN